MQTLITCILPVQNEPCKINHLNHARAHWNIRVPNGCLRWHAMAGMRMPQWPLLEHLEVRDPFKIFPDSLRNLPGLFPHSFRNLSEMLSEPKHLLRVVCKSVRDLLDPVEILRDLLEIFWRSLTSLTKFFGKSFWILGVSFRNDEMIQSLQAMD